MRRRDGMHAVYPQTIVVPRLGRDDAQVYRNRVWHW